MLKEITELQEKIIKAIKGHTTSEIVHAFKVIELELLLNTDDVIELVKRLK